jgi:DNA-binding winged helix-turn-helix (wHTH) protein/pimeloyl-ACP methyl ester carboxylesterase
MPTASTKPLCFDAYSLDLQRCSLQRGAERIELRPKAFDVLRYLVENAGRVISKEELIKVVWPGLSVTDDALVQCVSDIRQALSDEAHRIIKTVPRRGYLVAAETCTGSQREQVPAYPTQNIKFCRTRDGVHIAMACMGRGLPLVRTATWFNHLEYDWQSPLRAAFLRVLLERFQLVRYDGRGSGLSDRNVPEISFATFEEDLEAVVDAAGLSQYALLGGSQGAAIAIAHAVRHPDRVSKMVLHGACALGRNKRGSAKDMETAKAHITLMRHGWGDEHSAFLRTYSLLYFPGGSTQQIKELADLQRMATSAENAVRLRTASDDVDVVDLLSKVQAPTLVLHSKHDNMVPFDEGRRIASAIPSAKFVSLESENHMPLPGEPAWATFIGEIEAFLSA